MVAGSYTKKAVFGAFYAGIGLFVANLFGYLLRLILARNLTVEEYGLIYAVIAFFGLFTFLTSMGFGAALTKFISAARVRKRPEKIKEYILFTAAFLYGLSLLFVVVVVLLADWIAASYLGNPAAGSLIKIFAIVFFLSPLFMIVPGIFGAYQRFGLNGFFEALRAIMLFILAALLLWAGLQVEGVLWAYAATYLLMHVFMIPVVIRLTGMHRVRARFRMKTFRKLFLFGLPLVFTGLTGAILTQLDTVLLTGLSTLMEVGLYQAAQPTARILLVIPVIIATPMFPLIAELWVRKQPQRVANAIHDLLVYSVVGLLPLIIAVAAFPGIILNLLFGAEFVSAAPILLVLALSALFLTLNSIFSSTANGVGQPSITLKATLVGAAINIVLNVLLIPWYGGVGVAVATLVSSTAILCVGGFLLDRKVHFVFPWARWVRVVPAALLFYAVIAAFRLLPLANQYVKSGIAVILATAVYALATLLFKAVTMDELRGLLSRTLSR